jgi:hypothetical protein
MARNVAGRAAVMGRLTPGNSTPLRIGTIGSSWDMNHDLRTRRGPRNLAERLARAPELRHRGRSLRLDGYSSVVLERGMTHDEPRGAGVTQEDLRRMVDPEQVDKLLAEQVTELLAELLAELDQALA